MKKYLEPVNVRAMKFIYMNKIVNELSIRYQSYPKSGKKTHSDVQVICFRHSPNYRCH